MTSYLILPLLILTNYLQISEHSDRDRVIDGLFSKLVELLSHVTSLMRSLDYISWLFAQHIPTLAFATGIVTGMLIINLLITIQVKREQFTRQKGDR